MNDTEKQKIRNDWHEKAKEITQLVFSNPTQDIEPIISDYWLSILDKTIKSKLEAVEEEIAELNCPEAYGFEGLETFPDCGKCIVCRSKLLTKINPQVIETFEEKTARKLDKDVIDLLANNK
jgi:hypothetical protein